MNTPQPVNKTGRKTLDCLNNDPRVNDAWDEGEDGMWISLAPGWNWAYCSCVHEHTVREVLDALKDVQRGNPR